MENKGNYTENPNLLIHANQTIIKNQTITILPLETKTLTLTWNTTNFKEGIYLIKAFIPQYQTRKIQITTYTRAEQSNLNSLHQPC